MSRAAAHPAATAARVLRFGSVGAAGIGVQTAVLATLVHLVGVDYRVATAVAVGSAILHNFAWHRAWTWRDRRERRAALPALGRFAAANGLVSLAGNVVVMSVLVGVMHMPVVPANLIAIAACGVANYWLGDRVVFG